MLLVLWSSPNHTRITYWCPMKKSNQITPMYLILYPSSLDFCPWSNLKFSFTCIHNELFFLFFDFIFSRISIVYVYMRMCFLYYLWLKTMQDPLHQSDITILRIWYEDWHLTPNNELGWAKSSCIKFDYFYNFHSNWISMLIPLAILDLISCIRL